MSPQAWERLFTKSGLLDSERAKQAASDPQPLQFVVDQGWASRERALEAIATALKIAYTTFEKESVDAALVDEIGAERWQIKSVIPLASESHKVRIAMANPMDLMTVDEFTVTLNRQVEPVLALPSDINVQYRLLQAQQLPKGLKVCPKCEGDLVSIVYGYPSQEMVESADRGEILLGGCFVSDNDPQFRCKNCGRQYL
jgi:hypothetical protein